MDLPPLQGERTRPCHFAKMLLASPVVLAAWLLAACCLDRPSEAKTVVILPFPQPSHTLYHSLVAQQMTSRGHQAWVAVASYLLDRGYQNTSGFNVIPFDSVPGVEAKMQSFSTDRYFAGSSQDLYQYTLVHIAIYDSLLRNESFISTIAQKKPDLILIDNIPSFYVVSIIAYKLGVPFAFLGPVYTSIFNRVLFSPADVPINILPYSNEMTFFQRVHNSLLYMAFFSFNPAFPTDAVSTYAPDMKYVSLDELVTRAEIVLVESDHIMDYPKPLLPNVKMIGSTSVVPAKPLPPTFKDFMDSAKGGVVIVSFGSYMMEIPKHISDKILQVLLQLPMKSVFRSNLTSPDSEKIMMSAWIPQNDLLGHPNTKVFVSHCGKSGQYEALYHAVPTVATPFVLDQSYNAERARVKGFAEVLDLNTCTAQEMKSIILKVATEPQYKEAVVKRSRLFKELYGVPAERAAFWLEHVMEHGGDYMRSAGQQMPWYQFFLLDVLLFLLGVLALLAGLLYCLLRAMFRSFCSRRKTIKRE